METTASPTESDWVNLSKYLSKCSGSGVYVIYAARGDDKIPFYVGQSENIAARLGDYARSLRRRIVLRGCYRVWPCLVVDWPLSRHHSVSSTENPAHRSAQWSRWAL